MGFLIEVIDGEEIASIDAHEGSDLDYSRDWTKWLATAGASIATVEWSCGDTDITIHNPSRVGAVCTAFISGVKAGKEYWIDCKIVTDKTPPQTEIRCFKIVGKAHISQ